MCEWCRSNRRDARTLGCHPQALHHPVQAQGYVDAGMPGDDDYNENDDDTSHNCDDNVDNDDNGRDTDNDSDIDNKREAGNAIVDT